MNLIGNVGGDPDIRTTPSDCAGAARQPAGSRLRSERSPLPPEHDAPRGRDDAWRRCGRRDLWFFRGVTPPLVAPHDPRFWLIGALLPAILTYPKSVGWLADFERCAAWGWLDIATQTKRSEAAAKESIHDIALVNAWILGGCRGVPA